MPSRTGAHRTTAWRGLPALNLAFTDRHRYMTLDETVQVPWQTLMSREYATARHDRRIAPGSRRPTRPSSPARALPSYPPPGLPVRAATPRSSAAVDAEGNLVSMTSTILAEFGAGVSDPQTGRPAEQRDGLLRPSAGDGQRHPTGRPGAERDDSPRPQPTSSVDPSPRSVHRVVGASSPAWRRSSPASPGGCPCRRPSSNRASTPSPTRSCWRRPGRRAPPRHSKRWGTASPAGRRGADHRPLRRGRTGY